MPPPPTVVCQDVGTFSMKYIWLGTRAPPGPRYNPRGATTIILESGQISLARAGGIRPGRCRGRAGAAPQTPLPPRKSSSGSWGAVGLIMAPSLERLWGACGGREASQMRSGDFRETTRDDPNRLLGVPLGVGPPEGGPAASRRQPRRPKRGLPPQRRAGFNKYQKRMSISLRRKCARRRGEKPILVKRGCRANANHDG